MKDERFIKNLQITDIADEGRGMGRNNGYVVFVEQTVPGDVVDVKVDVLKKSFAAGRIASMIEKSPDRVEPVCEHFGVCGGCKWQFMTYEKQLFFKQNYVYETLTRIGKLNDFEIMPIIGSQKTFAYRNKLDYTFSDKRYLLSLDEGIENKNMNALGFHIPRRFDKILDITACHLMDDVNNRIRNFIRTYCLTNGLSFSNIKQHTGLLRSLIIRSTSTGGLMVIVVFRFYEENICDALLNALKNAFPEITSLIYVLNSKKNDTINDLPFTCFAGEPFITEQIEDLRFRIGPTSFFQTNTGQTKALYSVVRKLCNLSGSERVYDLYTGTGTIAQFIAKQAAHVIGIDYVEAAIDDARMNARLNNIHNATFFAGDIKQMLIPAFMSLHGHADVIITDPPRSGMHPDVTQTLAESNAKRIVYVSCNVATQARDLEILKNSYNIQCVQPVDMFPHTAHVENVVMLEIRN